MKYFAIIFTLCLLLVGCTALPESTMSPSAPMQQHETTPTVPQTDYPVPPENQPSTGSDSTGPAPEIGPEGLPTPAL